MIDSEMKQLYEIVCDTFNGVMQTMLKVKLDFGVIQLKENNNMTYDSMASIDIGGSLKNLPGAYKGHIAVYMYEKTHVHMANKLFMSEDTKISDSNKDIVGEILNIVAGNCKGPFRNFEIDIGMASPKVALKDEQNHLNYHANTQTVIIETKCEIGPLTIEINSSKIEKE